MPRTQRPPTRTPLVGSVNVALWRLDGTWPANQPCTHPPHTTALTRHPHAHWNVIWNGRSHVGTQHPQTRRIIRSFLIRPSRTSEPHTSELHLARSDASIQTLTYLHIIPQRFILIFFIPRSRDFHRITCFPLFTRPTHFRRFILHRKVIRRARHCRA